MSELKISTTDEINKFITTVTQKYKDKNKEPAKIFYDIWKYGEDKREGKVRKGLTLEDIQKQLTALGEGKYYLVDGDPSDPATFTKIEITVLSEGKKESPKKVEKVDNKESSREKNMSEENNLMSSLKDNGKDALNKMLHGAQVKGSSVLLDKALLKVWQKTGENEVFGMILSDPMANPAAKALVAFLVKMIFTEKSDLPGAEHLVKVADLIIEASGSEIIEPALDLLLPMAGELIAGAKEITGMKIDSLMAAEGEKKDDFNEEDAKKRLAEIKEKKAAEKNKTMTA